MKTAVEWLFDNLDLSGGSEAIETLKQAKEMEKEQIINAYEQGIEDGYWHPENGYSNEFQSAEQYYNETFKPE
jgi:hypothetical protein